MKIDFKQPKYILPLILLPFMLLLNFGMQSFYSEEEKEDDIGKADLQESVGNVSEQVRNRGIDGKLDAFRSRYKRADGYTAIKNMRVEVEQEDEILSQYNEAEKRMLDSIDLALKNTLNQPGSQLERRPTPVLEVNNNPSAQTDEDELILQALNQMESQQDIKEEPRYADPMDLFRAQMSLVDSISKANDPALQVSEKEIESETQLAQKPRLKVSKTSHTDKHFNTVRKTSQRSFIQAILDQEIRKGTLGERIRIRLLEDIQIGARELPKGTYLYAWISGYEAQRVKLTVSSVMVEDEILPIALNIYDQDGMEGLYVPASSFREFSKDLGGNVTGGMNLQMNQGASSMNQMYLSALQKVFTSSSQAMSKRIRQNKANLKYGTVIYLIDPEQLNPDIISN
ncbi:MAG: conjugative transposon protein TraM [Cytophagales bacterium]|uniref:conjugative transposon protein TraM n=1 Tax=Cyclobacterium marinum TaxID=104 RepID=UPI0030DBDC8E|nr:conjugative transposon protein TraM [Cytophagales bacterium]|tara:strand:+ start:3022 stop:4218 length:1197 start_codon:yes stop_codon:yes gene_type:complete